MKNKVLIGVVSSLLVLGGAIAVGASKNDERPDNSFHLDDKASVKNLDTQNLPEIKEGQEIELETEHGQTIYKIQSDDDSRNSTASQSTSTSLSIDEAAKIAVNKVNGTVTEVEKEMENGRLEYKFEIQTNQGEADVRVDAETGKITRVQFDDDQRDDRDDNDDDNNGDDDNSGIDG
jgi:uncharacterized membrane protein YkoI